jgi:dihydrolipoamide dehydrogenase
MMFDLVIIGSGPAGHTAALEAVKNKLKTALIEREPEKLGGVCLNEGCIPLKGLLHYSVHETDYHSIRGIVMQRVEFIRAGLKTRLQNAGVEMINGEARFLSANEIEVQGKKITAKNFLIAVGSSSKKIFSNPAVFSPEKIFDLNEIPQKALIIGGGVIGCEYASFLNNIGVSVDIVEKLESILFGEDEEAVRTVAREFKKKKIRLYENSAVTAISTEKDVEIKSGDTVIKDKYDMIFEAIGRRPNTGRIGLENAGITLNEGGFIIVNNNMQTSVSNIYAAGDCITTPMLAYAASREAAVVIDHITKGVHGSINYDTMPKLVFSNPQLGSVGLSESKAKQHGIDYKVYKYFFKAIGKAVVEGKDCGFLKLIADKKENIIIGAAGVGDEMTEIINELTVIIKSKMKIEDIKDCMHIHPSYSEIITEALNFG